jgi:tRNA pseudouridine32 synthase/23S rRNA pseudouridine746 synthase
MTPEEMEARLLYRDGLMLVIDKPAGYAVHKGPKGGESLQDYFGALRFGLPRAPELAHRLDRDTSGCLVLGRHRKALAALGKLFKSGAIGKSYWAVVEGGPEADTGRIDIPLGRLDDTRGWWMKPDPHGQPAVTEWRVMGRSPSAQQTPLTSAFASEVAAEGGRRAAIANAASRERAATSGAPIESAQLTWLALEPVTGRTHQLRVHCAAMGFPIVGDDIYGSAAVARRARGERFVPRAAPALHLHAREVVVPLYRNKDPVRVCAPVPEHMVDLLVACGWQGEVYRLVE